MKQILTITAVLLILILPVVACGEVLLDRVVAVVNGEVILWSELRKAMELDASPQMRELASAERQKIFKENEGAFLENLITLRLELQAARKQGFTVSDGEVKEAIAGIMKKYSMTDDAFRASIEREGLTYGEYKERLRDQILVGKVVGQQVRSKVVITDDDVRNFLEKDGDRIDKEEGFILRQILFKVPAKPEDRSTVEKKARAVLKRYEEGTPFEELAQQYSEGPMGKDGGSLGFVKASSLMKEFASVLSTMKEGDVSKPFWTDRGLHIIELQRKVPAKSPAEVKAAARELLTNETIDAHYRAWVKSLREQSFIESKL